MSAQADAVGMIAWTWNALIVQLLALADAACLPEGIAEPNRPLITRGRV